MNLFNEFVEALGQLLRSVGLHLVTEVFYKCLQFSHLLHVRFVVDTEDEGRSLLADRSGNVCGNSLVGQKHIFLDEPVGALGYLLNDIHRFSLFVHHNLHLRPFEADGTVLESLLAENGCEFVKFKHGCYDFL